MKRVWYPIASARTESFENSHPQAGLEPRTWSFQGAPIEDFLFAPACLIIKVTLLEGFLYSLIKALFFCLEGGYDPLTWLLLMLQASWQPDPKSDLCLSVGVHDGPLLSTNR